MKIKNVLLMLATHGQKVKTDHSHINGVRRKEMKTRNVLLMLAFVLAFAGAVQAATTDWMAPYATDSNTMGLWHFDEGESTTAADSSANPLNATLSGNASWASGGSHYGNDFSNCLSADGTASRVMVSSSNTGSKLDMAGESMTMECWLRFDNWVSAGQREIIEGHGSYYLLMTTGNIDAQFRGVVQKDTTREYIHFDYSSWTNDTWYHLAATWDGTYMRTYVNGEMTNEIEGTGSIDTFDVTNALCIGGTRNSNDVWVGEVDEVRISDMARSFTPEPASIVILLAGAIGLGFKRTRRYKSSRAG